MSKYGGYDNPEDWAVARIEELEKELIERMKVYLVLDYVDVGDWSEDRLVGVFSSRELADAEVERRRHPPESCQKQPWQFTLDDPFIEEIELNKIHNGRLCYE